MATPSNSIHAENIIDWFNIMIALFNVITTIFLTVMNLRFALNNKRKAYIHQAIFEYYLPLEYQLVNLERTQKVILKIYGCDSVDMFNTNNYNLRKKIIEEAIIPFVDFFDQINKYYFYPHIDKMLISLIKYYKTLIQINGIEKNLDLDSLKKEYPDYSASDIIVQLERICTL